MLLGFTGDLFLGAEANEHVFEQIAADLGTEVRLIANFEGTLFAQREDLKPMRRKILLESPAEAFAAVKRLPIAMLCAGNNHIGDYGNQIAEFTLRRAAADYPIFGAGYSGEPFHRASYRETDVSIGFANYATADCSPLFTTPDRIGPRPLDLAQVTEDLKLLRASTDHVIAIVHWGLEDFHYPRPAQVHLGRKLIDLGFTAVIGHHPHTVQGYETYKGRSIFYSLGNFYFPDHSVTFGGVRSAVKWTRRRSWGIVPLFDVSRSRVDLRDVKIVSLPRGRPPTVSASPRLAARLKRLSDDLAAGHYWHSYRSWRRSEERAIRLHEVFNNEHKWRSLGKRVKRALGIKMV